MVGPVSPLLRTETPEAYPHADNRIGFCTNFTKYKHLEHIMAYPCSEAHLLTPFKCPLLSASPPAVFNGNTQRR